MQRCDKLDFQRIAFFFRNKLGKMLLYRTFVPVSSQRFTFEMLQI